jgi:hypothetical protein
MKKIYLILSVFAIVFTACETDFDVNAEWEETTVVYGLLDATDTDIEKKIQKIKISKAFLGNMDAYQMAQYADSINFDTANIDVMIYKWGFNEIEDSVSLNAVPNLRDGDIFNDSIVVYEFVNENSFLQKEYEYELVVKNNKSGNIVTSRTSIISTSPSWSSFVPSQYNFGFYKKDENEFDDKKINWRSVDGGKLYQLNILFQYSEENTITGKLDSITINWLQPLQNNSNNPINVELEGVKFFNFLKDNINENDEVIRVFNSISVQMTVGSEDLETYINVNKPITGIVQERPSFTNINNGIGLFSSRFTSTNLVGRDLNNINIKGLSGQTHFYINENLNRNFNYPYTTD